jgi:hypothetical protein
MDEIDNTNCYIGSGTAYLAVAHGVDMTSGYRTVETARTGGGTNRTIMAIDGVQKVDSSAYASTSSRHPVFHAYNPSTVIYVDLVAIRKYTASEPLTGTAKPSATNRALSRPISQGDLIRACCS